MSAPWLNASGTVLYFAFSYQGAGGPFKLWRALRSDTASPFEEPEALAGPSCCEEMGSCSDPWLSSDQRTLYFACRMSSNNWDIYEATRD